LITKPVAICLHKLHKAARGSIGSDKTIIHSDAIEVIADKQKSWEHLLEFFGGLDAAVLTSILQWYGLGPLEHPFESNGCLGGDES
jgi:hypothetical protein